MRVYICYYLAELLCPVDRKYLDGQIQVELGPALRPIARRLSLPSFQNLKDAFSLHEY